MSGSQVSCLFDFTYIVCLVPVLMTGRCWAAQSEAIDSYH